MARLPVLRKRRSKGQQALDTIASVAKVWTAVRASKAAGKAAKRGAKAYGAAKGAKMVARPVVKLLAVPAAAAGGAFAWRKLRSDDSDGDRLGPVASAASVSPPHPIDGARADEAAGTTTS
ncbi:MAG: hypothetical protein QOJ82_3467 [Solirubrobacteraceae bacterium]|jgi:hypothetical protein|nr:hypothetical protein [Solirubrobacteraceae bacterium]